MLHSSLHLNLLKNHTVVSGFPCSIEISVDVDLRVKEEDTNYGFDERLMRRCKRRRIAFLFFGYMIEILI